MNQNKSGNDFCVVLEKVGNQPLLTMKALMQATGLGLSEAKKMLDDTPVTVVSGLDSKKACKLKAQLEVIGNAVSIPGLEAETTEKAVGKKKTTAKAPTPKEKATAKTSTSKEKATVKAPTKKGKTTDDGRPSDLDCALTKVCEIVGKDGFMNGERVCNLLGDLVPKLEKERRRIKMAYASNAVASLFAEKDTDFAVNEAVKRLIDYSDMADDVARATILAIYEVLK